MGVIIGLFPELLAPGGIQRVSRHVGAVLAAIALERGLGYCFLSLNDPLGLHRVRVADDEFSVSGFSRAKLRFVLAALRSVRRRPALVVAAHVHLAPVAWAMKMRAPRLRVVVLTHGIEVWQPLSRLRRWALRRADLVLAPSADTAHQLATKQGVSPEKICQMAWGLDPQFSALLGASENKHLPAGFPAGRVVLTVGRWAASERYKGVDTLIAAVRHLLPAVPDLFLVAVGEGDDRGRLEQLAAELGVSGHVRFLSALTQQELLACYRRCDVFALPSRGEGFGLVFLEAMANGKPVIGPRFGAPSEFIRHGEHGLLVDPEDIAGVAQAVIDLLTSPELAAHMGQAGKQKVTQEYSYNRFCERLRQALSELT